MKRFVKINFKSQCFPKISLIRLERLGLLLALFLFTSYPVKALTLSDIRTQVRINIRDTDATNQRYSDTVINSLINEGQRNIVNMTWLAMKTTSYILSAGTSYYALPNDFLAAEQVYFKDRNGVTLKLNQMTQGSLYDKNPDWERFQNQPVQYWISNATAPVPTSSSTLRVSYIPIPQTTSTGTVTIWYDSEVVDLASDSDIPFNGIRNLVTYHASLIYYATFRIEMIDGISDESKFYGDLFTGSIAAMKDRLGRLPNYMPSFSSK